ncbi:MAG: hypothetical protein ACK5X5_04535 [bacterium]|jgi:filamentous hemagglutinin
MKTRPDRRIGVKSGAGTKPVPSLEARTRGRQLFDAAINGTRGQVALGPANDSSSVAQTFPSTPGGAATHRPRPRLAGDRVINVGVGTMQTALDVVAATEAPVVSQVAGASSALISVWQRDWVGAGVAVAGMAPIIGAGADATRLGVRAADAAKGAAEASSLANAARLRGQLAGKEIAGGHAFEKHVLNQGEFKGLGIRTREQFANHIENVVNNPTASRQLSGGRPAYWQDSTGTVVIRNPRAADGGTAFQPTNGRAYFDGLR